MGDILVFRFFGDVFGFGEVSSVLGVEAGSLRDKELAA